MDASTGWVVGSEGIVRTDDGGATWKRQFWMRTDPLYGISRGRQHSDSGGRVRDDSPDEHRWQTAVKEGGPRCYLPADVIYTALKLMWIDEFFIPGGPGEIVGLKPG